jgi:hypothetical protein
MPDYAQRVSEVLANTEKYHQAYYEVKTFGGPSLHFHRKSLEYGDIDFTRRLEYIYATLTAWGMHRMGKGGSKMLPFEEFRSSMIPLETTVEEVKKFQPDELNETAWSKVEAIFKGIKIMATETRIVGNSKVMAHLIPNIVAPIDREYTLRYLRGNTNIRNGIAREWLLMKKILSEFFVPVSGDQNFRSLAAKWISDQDRFP